jgi:predicted nucleic acid-binding protein
MIVDSCVWIDYFNARDTSETDRLRIALHETPEQIFTCNIIYMEILSGFPLNHQKRFEQARRILDCFEILELQDKESAVRVIRKLRDKGITLKGFQNGLLDVMIAQTAIDNAQSILTANIADFRKIGLVAELSIEEAYP